MNELGKRPMLVDVFLQGARISGVSRSRTERHRLVDLLNSADEALELESVKVTLNGSGQAYVLPSLAVEKRSIIAAVPRETQDQSRMRASLSTGMGRLTATRVQLAVVLPPMYVEGTAYVAIGGGRLRADDVFPRFFAVSAAKIVMAGGSSLDVPVVVIHRDAVAGLAQLS